MNKIKQLICENINEMITLYFVQHVLLNETRHSTHTHHQDLGEVFVVHQAGDLLQHSQEPVAGLRVRLESARKQ